MSQILVIIAVFLSSLELPNASAASNVPEGTDMATEGDEVMATDGELPHFSRNDVVICVFSCFSKKSYDYFLP